MSRTNYSSASVATDSAKILRRRIEILRRVVLVLLAIILIRLFFIQIVEHGAWVAKADEEHTLLETIVAKRGEIYMMDEGNTQKLLPLDDFYGGTDTGVSGPAGNTAEEAAE